MSHTVAIDEILFWLLGSVRLLAVFSTAPIFGHRGFPVRGRVVLAMAVVWLLSPKSDFQPSTAAPVEFALVLLWEVMAGAALGFATRLIFGAFSLFGEFVSVQGGLGAARVVDPSSGAPSVALASLFDFFMLMVFLAIDGHHEVLRAAALSYEMIPIGSGGPSVDVFQVVVTSAAMIFEVAVRLAAPITITMLVTNVALGILGRAIPQMNLMMLQLPAHVGILLGLVMLGAGSFIRFSANTLDEWAQTVLRAVAGAS